MSELQVGDLVVVKVGPRKGQSGVVTKVKVISVDVRLPKVDNGPLTYTFEEVQKLLPAGTRVRFGDTDKTGVVVDVGTDVDRPGGYALDTWVSCERVRQDSDGRVLLWNAKAVKVLDDPEPEPAPAPELWPVKTLVRSKKYGNLGTVVEHRGATVRVRYEDNGATASYPEPEKWLERVYVITHDELSVLDRSAGMDMHNDGREVLDRFLRPTVKRTFTVTVEQPVGDSPVDGGVLEMVMKSDDSLAYPVTVISTEEGAR